MSPPLAPLVAVAVLVVSGLWAQVGHADGPADGVADAAATTSQAPAKPQEQGRVLVLDPQGELTPSEAQGLQELLVSLLEERLSVPILSTNSIRERLDVEAQKQLVGCAEDACLAEIAGALDTRFLLISRVSGVGGTQILRLELYDAQKVETLARSTQRGTSIAELVRLTEPGVDALTSQEGVRPLAGPIAGPRRRPGAPASADAWKVPAGWTSLAVGTGLVALWGVAYSVYGLSALPAQRQAALAYAAEPSEATHADLAEKGSAARRAAIVSNASAAGACLGLGAIGFGTWAVLTAPGDDP
jgi:hypothetical protein